MNQSATHHRSLRSTIVLALLAVALGMFAHAATAHGASPDQKSGASSRGDQTSRKSSPSSSSNRTSAPATSKSSGKASTEEPTEWKSRRTAGKWIPSENDADRPAVKSVNSTAPPKKVASARETSRKPSPMVFIAGKTESGSAADTNPPSPPSSMSSHSDETQAATKASVPHEEKHSANHDAPESKPSSTVGVEHPSPSHGDPQFFDAPLLRTPDVPSDQTPDGSPVTSATEQFKQMLLQQQSDLENQSSSSTSSHGETHHDADKSAMGGSSSISSLPQSTEEDLRSDDPLRREKAARFLKLREQLLQLKSLNRLPRAQKHTTPEASHDSHASDASSIADGAHTAPDEHHSDHGSETESHAAEHAADQNSATPNQHPEHAGEHAEDGHNTHGDSHQGAAPDPHGSDAAEPHAAESHTDNAHDEAGHETGRDDGHEAGHEEGAMTHEAGDPAAHQSGEGTTAHMVGSIPDPIDRVSLGNNLYALGEYPAAHKAYLSVIPEELSAEQQFWTEFQIANCLRRMGENAEASNRFRKIASQPEAGWLSERAAWWVDILEQIRKAESEVKEAESNTEKGSPKSKLPISGSSKEASHDNHHH